MTAPILPAAVRLEILEGRIALATLDQPGSFRVRFTCSDGEENVDRGEYPIDVHSDAAPTVVLTSPAKDVALPENGTLEIEGRASDDFGVKELALYVRVMTGSSKPNLQPKLYRPDKSFQFADGSYPDAIDYKDFLALDELKDDKGLSQRYTFAGGVEFAL